MRARLEEERIRGDRCTDREETCARDLRSAASNRRRGPHQYQAASARSLVRFLPTPTSASGSLTLNTALRLSDRPRESRPRHRPEAPRGRGINRVGSASSRPDIRARLGGGRYPSVCARQRGSHRTRICASATSMTRCAMHRPACRSHPTSRSPSHTHASAIPLASARGRARRSAKATASPMLQTKCAGGSAALCFGPPDNFGFGLGDRISDGGVAYGGFSDRRSDTAPPSNGENIQVARIVLTNALKCDFDRLAATRNSEARQRSPARQTSRKGPGWAARTRQEGGAAGAGPPALRRARILLGRQSEPVPKARGRRDRRSVEALPRATAERRLLRLQRVR